MHNYGPLAKHRHLGCKVKTATQTVKGTVGHLYEQRHSSGLVITYGIDSVWVL